MVVRFRDVSTELPLYYLGILIQTPECAKSSSLEAAAGIQITLLSLRIVKRDVRRNQKGWEAWEICT